MREYIKYIQANKNDIVADIVEKLLQAERSQKTQSTIFKNMGASINNLLTALELDSQTLFTDYLQQLNLVLKMRREMATNELVNVLMIIKERICSHVPERHHPILASFFQAALDSLSESTATEGFIEDNPLAKNFLNLILKGNRREATDLILEKAKSGVPVDDIMLDVLQPVLREVGRLWQINEINVAHEHYITATTQSIMSRLYEYMSFASNVKNPVLVAACVHDELHEIGVRMLADVFENAGWHSIYLGANVPADSLVQMIEERHPDLVALSCTLLTHIEDTHTMIETIRKEIENPPPILVGGYPFNIDENLWKAIGADGHAKDAKSALILANKLINHE